MVKRNSGKIVNITSVGGKVSVPHLVPYTCAKFSATGFSEGLRSELAPQGVQVSTIVPGLMRTGSFVNALFKGDQEAEAKWFSAGSSLPILTMTADRAAKKIVTAVKRNEAETILTTGAKTLSSFHGAFPGAAANILGVIAASILPAVTGQTGTKSGREIAALQSPWMRIALTLGRAAMGKYRQQVA